VSARSAWLGRRLALALVAFASMSAATRWTFLMQPDADYRWHARAAAELASSGDPATPHFLFQALLIALHSLTPARDWVESALDLTVLCQVALALLTASLLEAAWPRPVDARAAALAAGLALALIVAGPVNLASWGEHNLYLGYLSRARTTTPRRRCCARSRSPSGCGPACGSSPPVRRRRARRSRMPRCRCSPCWRSRARRSRCCRPWCRWRRCDGCDARRWTGGLLLGFVAPVLLVLAWQYVGLVGGGATLEWAPLRVMSLFPGSKLARLLLSLLFPLCVVVLRWPAVRRDGALILAWLSFGVGLVWVYGVAERGERFTHANLLWTGQVTLFVLFVASVRLLVREPDASRWRAITCWLAFGLHLAGGLALCLRPSWW